MIALTAPRERPILFAAAMVRAILDGRKTQTRRIYRHRPCDSVQDPNGPLFSFPTPYGSPGDRLWVRETWAPASREHHSVADYPADGRPRDACNYWAWYAASDEVDGPWTPSIFMPRWASRIKLEVTAVRVQRLQEISEDDALAEGVTPGEAGDADLGGSARGAFYRLWDDINGTTSPMLDDDGKPVLDDNERPIMHAPKTWSNNPWVWAITFSRVT